MSGAHRHALYLEGSSPLHRLRPHTKLAAHLGFVIAVVATPREAFWAFAAFASLIGAVLVIARVPAGVAARRLAIETPFIFFAVLLPFLGRGERVDVAGIALSSEGLWGAWNIIAKATLGTAATIALASTTKAPEILQGLERLKVPRALTTTAGFMVRYADVIADDLRRMRIARQARCYQGRWLWQGRAVASSAGALFIRTYERGERVFCAMQSRGYTGRLPETATQGASAREWATVAVLPIAAVAVASSAWVLR